MLGRTIRGAMLLVLCCAGASWAQEPPKEMERLKADVGMWDAEIRMFGDPSSEPDVTKGSEHNFMLGGMWLITHFKGEMMGMPFEGSSQMTFNPDTKKYTGSWVDSMSPYPMAVEATWDDATKTLTQHGKGKNTLGEEQTMKMTTVYGNDGSRTFTMFVDLPNGESMKALEIKYTKSKQGGAKAETAK